MASPSAPAKNRPSGVWMRSTPAGNKKSQNFGKKTGPTPGKPMTRRSWITARFSTSVPKTEADRVYELLNVLFIVEKMYGDAKPADARRVALRDQDVGLQQLLKTFGVAFWAITQSKSDNPRALMRSLGANDVCSR